jgi:hypothetical protein
MDIFDWHIETANSIDVLANFNVIYVTKNYCTYNRIQVCSEIVLHESAYVHLLM